MCESISFLHLKVAGMKHVSDDDNFFVPLPEFSLLLGPPVQLSVGTKQELKSSVCPGC